MKENRKQQREGEIARYRQPITSRFGLRENNIVDASRFGAVNISPSSLVKTRNCSDPKIHLSQAKRKVWQTTLRACYLAVSFGKKMENWLEQLSLSEAFLDIWHRR